jgi:phage tail sheath protein FI
MASSYKTPGVFVEEIVKFPPSVAQVETAIPAFIGYTEKARSSDSAESNDLIMEPTRITSLLDYETLFGFAQPERGIVVRLTDTQVNNQTNRVITVPEIAVKSPYHMYYSMQMYFANGGGPCYIVSTGLYADWGNPSSPPAVSFANFKDGLDTLKKEDEPTLIVFPDATSLTNESELYALYNLALTQCNKMQDRFAIFDTYKDTLASVTAFRNNITSDKDFAKYGATYFPHLKTILNYQYTDADVQVEHITYAPGAIAKAFDNLMSYIQPGGLPAKVSAVRDLTVPGPGIGGLIHDARLFMFGGGGFNLMGVYAHTVVKTETLITQLEALTDKLTEIDDIKKDVNVDARAAKASLEENSTAQADVQAALNTFNALFEGPDKLEEVLKNIKDLIAKLKKSKSDAAAVKKLLDGSGTPAPANFVIGELTKLVNYSPIQAVYGVGDLTVTSDLFATMASGIDALANEVNAASGFDKNNGEYNGRPLSNVLPMDNATYNQIRQEISKRTVTLAPSAAMAGIYARVDANNGVWKAPANVSVNFVMKPTYAVSQEEQADLNVTTTGKSINAIRSFTGKGTLVWGARTLAGNDNEWRYISVRRFFNMVEESTKKATEQFVFEGNDPNTWVRLRAMIENFLTLQWRAGALAGAKPDQAFFVRVGLGQTMTADDILNGRLIVEIGMAVVRPAEFIILRFSHKMQEA